MSYSRDGSIESKIIRVRTQCSSIRCGQFIGTCQPAAGFDKHARITAACERGLGLFERRIKFHLNSLLPLFYSISLSAADTHLLQPEFREFIQRIDFT